MQGERAEDCPTHLWQMHVCLPAKKGHTRLLYRMSTDFMGWTDKVPFIDKFWRYIADRVSAGWGWTCLLACQPNHKYFRWCTPGGVKH